MGAHERLLAGQGRLPRLSQLLVLLPPLDCWLELLTNLLEFLVVFLALLVLEVSLMSAVDMVVDLKLWGVPSAVALAALSATDLE